jgi:hypothetical protein
MCIPKPGSGEGVWIGVSDVTGTLVGRTGIVGIMLGGIVVIVEINSAVAGTTGVAVGEIASRVRTYPSIETVMVPRQVITATQTGTMPLIMAIQTCILDAFSSTFDLPFPLPMFSS